jgi:hypothetical protein
VIVEGPSLVISARVAAALEQAVTDAEAKARRDGVPVDAEVAATLAELHELADRWRAFAERKSAGPAAEAAASSATMTTSEAAAVLDVSASRIRQRLRAGTLAGTCTSGRWSVDRAAVEGEHR